MMLLRGLRNFPKHCKTALVSIWRNGVMSFSSIFAVTITLILISVVMIIAANVNKVTTNIENSLTIYVKVEREASDADSKAIQPKIEAIAGVKKVTYSSKDKELDKLIESQDESNKKLFENYRKDNPLGDSYQVEVKNVNKLEEVAKQIEDIENVNEVTYGGASTNRLVTILENIRNGGLIFVIALVAIVLFMISNTIKMAITARSTEIAIMRMVGASNWYIRIPFMLEGAFIGVFGAIIPMLIVSYGYSFAYESLMTMMSGSLMVFVAPHPFVYHLDLALVVLGAGVGLIGSFFSVRKFLKF